jgi:hypothetical protein
MCPQQGQDGMISSLTMTGQAVLFPKSHRVWFSNEEKQVGTNTTSDECDGYSKYIYTHRKEGKKSRNDEKRL